MSRNTKECNSTIAHDGVHALESRWSPYHGCFDICIYCGQAWIGEEPPEGCNVVNRGETKNIGA